MGFIVSLSITITGVPFLGKDIFAGISPRRKTCSEPERENGFSLMLNSFPLIVIIAFPEILEHFRDGP